jgi:hypothetical protein
MVLSPPFISCLICPEKIAGNVCAYGVAGLDFPGRNFYEKN